VREGRLASPLQSVRAVMRRLRVPDHHPDESLFSSQHDPSTPRHGVRLVASPSQTPCHHLFPSNPFLPSVRSSVSPSLGRRQDKNRQLVPPRRRFDLSRRVPALPKNSITKARKDESTKKTKGISAYLFCPPFRVFVLSCFRDWLLVCKVAAFR
jgi:hypothetical protein